MSKHNEICPTCGHAQIAYPYSLNVGKVQALKELVRFYYQHKRPAKMDELQLTNPQYTNFSHLRYFGLTQKIDKGWIPTPFGMNFIHGESACFDRVAEIAGNVLSNDHEFWNDREDKPELKFVKEIDETAYQQRPEFAAEKQNTLL